MLAASAAILLALVGPAATVANSDPHRFFAEFTAVDVPEEWCGFPVHIDAPVNREYGRESIAADGTYVLEVTGAFFMTATNMDTDNGKMVTFNASGPGTFTIPADSTFMIGDFRGRAFVFGPNITDFGYPSNMVVVAGPIVLTQELGELAFTSISRAHVLLDVCAALR